MATITIPGMFLTGNHAARPSSGVGKGTLYACSTHTKIYQATDTGATWVDWYTAAASGGASTFVGARISEATAQTLSDDTLTALTSNDAEIEDSDGFHDTSSNTSRMTIPAGKGGRYDLHGLTAVQSNATGYRQLRFRIDGTTYIAAANPRVFPVNGAATHVEVNALAIALTAGQYVEIMGYHFVDGGTSLTHTLLDFSIVQRSA
jgi:hypothetical protein